MPSLRSFAGAYRAISVIVAALLLLPGCRSTPNPPDQPSSVAAPRPGKEGFERALVHGGTNGAALAAAGESLTPTQGESFGFLLAHMPERDLQRLPPSWVVENVVLAGEAMAQAPWRDRIPREIFLNDILPYACVNERRDDWRRILRDKSAPLVTDCRTPSEAAQRLNQKLFKLVNVRYSTGRRRADQSPLESMDSGLATCTGLSILLIDACRSIGVPARLVGTPLWSNLRGNHTWVEIWDGDWHFTGAAEPDPKGLDRGWFRNDAAQAKKDEPRHAIYATSFAQTGLSFPLVWAPRVDWVNAVNVTDRYTAKTKPAETGKFRLLVQVLDQPNGRRVEARLTVAEATNTTARLEGRSKGESADRNDFAAFAVARDRVYMIEAESGEHRIRKEFRPGPKTEELVVLHLSEATVGPATRSSTPAGDGRR